MTREPTEMELRVARAMFEASMFKDAGPWEAQSSEYRRLAIVQARAAIRAMREPTDEMEVAGSEEWMCSTATYEDRSGLNWRAMIDTASPPEGP